MVTRGYAKNYLIPKKLVALASPENTQLYGPPSEKAKEERLRRIAAEKAQKKLSKVKVIVKRHIMPDGSLHAPVSRENISEKLFLQYRIELNPTEILLDTPLIALGDVKVKVLMAGNEVILPVSIIKR